VLLKTAKLALLSLGNYFARCKRSEEIVDARRDQVGFGLLITEGGGPKKNTKRGSRRGNRGGYIKEKDNP